jgi:hexosaminidase
VYLDAPPDRLSLERVYGFDPIPDSAGPDRMKHTLGGEAELWSEGITPANLDPMAYPRLLAVAEALWSEGPKSYPEFAARLEQDQEPRLAAMGVTVGPRDRAIVSLGLGYDSATRRIAVRADRGMPGVEIRTVPSPIPDSGAVTVQALLGGKPLPIRRRFTLEPHLAWGRPVTLATPPAAQYPGTGANSLTDHALGSTDPHDGLWQGWWGPDLEATIDLGADRTIRSVMGSFLQDVRSWIVFPKRVTVSVSHDAVSWDVVGSAAPGVLPNDETALTRLIGIRPDRPVKARWIRLEAESSGPLPAGHPGAGQPSWIFADEIIVK